MASKAQAREFSDLWGEMLHSGRWYRALTLFLCVVNLVLVFVVALTVTRPDPLPLVVRVDEVGRAEIVDYQVDRAELDQNSPVVGYFLNDFVVGHYARRHALRAERWERSLVFMTPDLQTIAYNQDVDSLGDFLSNPDAPELLIENIVVRIIPQPEPPYRAEVIFDRVETYIATEVSRERLVLSVQFVFADEIPAEAQLINPLGIVIVFMDVQRQLVGVGDDAF